MARRRGPSEAENGPPVQILRLRVDTTKTERAKQLRTRLTSAERKLWQHLRTNALGGLHFRRQQVISGFIVDFYCHAARLIVEVDGDVHGSQPDYDAERDHILSAQGLTVLRFRNSQIEKDLEAVLRRIRQHAGFAGPA